MVETQKKRGHKKSKGDTIAKAREKSIQKLREQKEFRAVQRRLKAKHKKELKRIREKSKQLSSVVDYKREAVIGEYFKCFNKTRAYTRVYGRTPNVGDLVYRFFKQESVKEEIAKRFAELRPQIDQTIVMFQDRAEASIEDFTTYDEMTGKLVYDDVKAEASGKKHLLKEIEFGEFGYIKKIKIADQEYSLDKVAKSLQMYSDVAVLPAETIQSGTKKLQKLLEEIHEKDGSGNTKGK